MVNKGSAQDVMMKVEFQSCFILSCLFAQPVCLAKPERSSTTENNVKCHECGRQFVEHPQKKMIDQATLELIDRTARTPFLAGIARNAGFVTVATNLRQ